MCTAISDNLNGHFLARTLDVERSYGERILGVGRSYALPFLHEATQERHPFIMGVGIERNGYPLFFDALNECGLAMAGLSFPKSAKYLPSQKGKTNVASFEVIPFLLSKCGSVGDARALLCDLVVTDDAFSPDLPSTPLHWIIADKNECIVAEPREDGLRIYENPIGVLTNEPPFPCQLDGYKELSYSLSESFSSRARFCRAQYVKSCALVPPAHSLDGVSRIFSITSALRVPYACSCTPDGKPSYTAYTSCADTQDCAYYMQGYSIFDIRWASIRDFDADADLICEI